MLDVIEDEVLKRCKNYFRDVYFSAPAAAQQYLKYLSAHAIAPKQHDNLELPQIDATEQRWLRRRLLMTAQGQLNIPMFGRWIREYSDAY